jgi:hydroxymethylbilane synthase
MPAVLPEGLAIAAVLPREDPLDAIVLPVMAQGSGLMATAPAAISHEPSAMTSVEAQPSAMTTVEDLVARLGQTPVLGTGSVRRVSQLSRLFSAARFESIRGNLDTRLRKLDNGGFDGLVLAAAGLRRLGFASRISLALPASVCVPAPGQGIVAIEIREDDGATRDSVCRIDDPAASAALTAERAVVTTLGGGCQTPIGAFASEIDDSTLELMAIVVALDGSRAVRAHARGARHEAAALGERVGAMLLDDGAGAILAEAGRHESPAPTHPA